MILAAESAPPEIALWLGCLAFVVVLVNGVLKLADRLKSRPEPAAVQAEARATYATREEVIRLKAALDTELKAIRDEQKVDLKAIMDRLEQMHIDLNTNSERRIIAVHDRLNQIAADVAIAKDRTEHPRDHI